MILIKSLLKRVHFLFNEYYITVTIAKRGTKLKTVMYIRKGVCSLKKTHLKRAIYTPTKTNYQLIKRSFLKGNCFFFDEEPISAFLTMISSSEYILYQTWH